MGTGDGDCMGDTRSCCELVGCDSGWMVGPTICGGCL